MYRIVESDLDTTMLEIIEEDEKVLRFSVEDVDPKARNWLGEYLSHEVSELIHRTRSGERQRIQHEIKILLGISR